jgi:ribulose-5-phosphate 4-epimerase/fuculose-1-phosphate aldolase
MITQDSLRFYNSHGVYKQFGGVVLAEEEGKRIAEALGPRNKAVILQNHGILTVGQSVDEAAFWFLSLDKTCQAQLLVDAAVSDSKPKNIIPDKEAEESFKQVGTPEKGWLAFQGYYDEIMARTGGDFLK